MMGWRGTLRLLALGIAAGLLGLAVRPLLAREASQEFLDGLRQRGYFDTARDYLETIRTSPLVDKAFAEVIDYEIGATLVTQARLVPLVDREKRLNEARSSFEKFLNDHPLHPLALSATADLGNLLVERGRVRREQAGQLKRTPEQKQQFLTEARTLYRDAQRMFTTIDAQLAERRKQYKTVSKDDTQRIEERNQIYRAIMRTRLALASIVYETAQSYEPGSQEWKDNMAAAAAKFGDYYKTYQPRMGAYDARIEEARCQQQLGDYAQVMTILGEIVTKAETDEDFCRRRSTGTLLAMQTCLLPQMKKYEDALNLYDYWEKNIGQRDEATPTALAIKYLAGEAALEYARGLQGEDLQTARLHKRVVLLARELLPFVGRHPGEYRQKARVKLSDPLLGGGELAQDATKNYEESRDRGQNAWELLQEQSLKPEEESRLVAEALRNYRLALIKAPPDTKIEDLNNVRYRLAYLYWATDDLYEASVAGEFLARRYPDRPEAQQGAKIALAACAKLLGDMPRDGDRTFEKDRLMGIARFITERWPNSSAADEAWMTLIRAAVMDHDMPKTVEYLGHVSVDSPRRGETELLTGRAWWVAYLEAARRPEAERPSKAEMAKIFAQARKTLEDGVGRLRKAVDEGGEASYPLAEAVLSLAQICLEAGQADKAVAWLDDPLVGPHTLVRTNNKATDRGNFRVRALTTSLRAYVASKQLEPADETMAALEKASEGDNLTRIYLSLGRQLEESLKRSGTKDDPEEAAKVARGFTAFLDRIAARPRKETSFHTLSWVGEMFMNLAASQEQNNGRLSDDAVEYYQKAASAYSAILEACKEDEQYAPQPDATHSVRIRLARCLCRLGKHEEALEALVEVLKVQNNMVEAQREAARNYQAWAVEKPSYYVDAIRGGYEVEQGRGPAAHLAWGWAGLASRVQSYPDLFHEARYNLALCRFQYAMTKSGRERKEQMELARRDIVVVAKLYPAMGGKQWYEQYDTLLQKIQRQLGVNEEGLKAYAEKPRK
jgi:cellulose synthase operon protein C